MVGREAPDQVRRVGRGSELAGVHQAVEAVLEVFGAEGMAAVEKAIEEKFPAKIGAANIAAARDAYEIAQAA